MPGKFCSACNVFLLLLSRPYLNFISAALMAMACERFEINELRTLKNNFHFLERLEDLQSCHT